MSMADRRKNMHKEILEDMPKNAFETVIPYASDVERMGEERSPVVEYAPYSAAWKAYSSLWEELEQRLDKVK